MLWEDGFRAWRHFGFVAQPAAALLDRDGTVLRTWAAMPNEAEVLRLVGS